MPKYEGKTNWKDFISEFLETTSCYAESIGLHVHLLCQSLEGPTKNQNNVQPYDLVQNFPKLVKKIHEIFPSPGQAHPYLD